MKKQDSYLQRYLSNQSGIHEIIHVIRYFPHLNVFEHESETTKTTQLYAELNCGTWKESCYLRDRDCGDETKLISLKSFAILSLILCTPSAQFRGERLHNTSDGRGGISFCAIRFETRLGFVYTERKRTLRHFFIRRLSI